MGRESPGAWAKQQTGGGEGGSCPLQQGCGGWAPCLQPPLEPTMPRVTGMGNYHAAGHRDSRGGSCPGVCPLSPQLTQSKMCHRLHLTEVS